MELQVTFSEKVVTFAAALVKSASITRKRQVANKTVLPCLRSKIQDVDVL